MVALSSLAGAGWQFFDNNGDPLSGGKLYTYAAGTTTPATTYTSSTAAVANANPIILDSAGRVADEIWLVFGDNYKFVLTSATNTTIWTKDNVPGIFAAASISAADVTVSGGGSVQDILGPQSAYVSKIVDAKRYGLVPNDQSAGPANYTALSNAISAADNKILQFPEDTGIYEFAVNPGTASQAAQTATFTNVTEIRGGATLQNLRFVTGVDFQRFVGVKQRYANFTGNINSGNTVAIRHSGVVWRDFSLQAQSPNQDGNTGNFDIGRASSGMIRNISLVNGAISNGSVDSIDVYGNVDGLMIQNVRLQSGDDGIVLKSATGTGPVRNVIIDSCNADAASLFAIGTQVAFDIHDITVSNCLAGPRASAVLYIKNNSATVFGGAVYNVSMSNITIKSPANPSLSYSSVDPYVQKIMFLSAANGGRINNVSLRNVRFDGVTLSDTLGGGTALFVDCAAGATVGNIVVDGLDIYQRDPGSFVNAAVWEQLLFFRGAGTYGPFYLGNVTYDAYSDVGLATVIRSGSGAASQIVVNNPINIKRCAANTSVFTLDAPAGNSIAAEINANIALPTAAAVTTSANFLSGASPTAKAQRQVTARLPDITAGVNSTVSVMSNARRCLVTRVTITTPTAVTQNNTNYLTLELRGTSSVVTATTQLTGGINIAANTQVDLATPNIAAVVSSGDPLRFIVTHSGAGQNLNGATLTIHLIDLE